MASHVSPKTYISGEEREVHEAHHHVMPISTYVKVFGALLVLTVLTILVSFAGLGAASLPVAMLVAFVKAGLVVGFFMHLKYDDRFNSFVFFCTLVFVAIFFVLTMADLSTRDRVQGDWDNHTFQNERIEANPDWAKSKKNFFEMESSHH